MTEPIAVDRRTGAAAAIAGVLLFASVAAELVWSGQRPDGTVTSISGLVLEVCAWTAGAAALTVALLGMRPVAVSRAGAAGRRISVVGAGLLTVFGVVVLMTALASGVPWETSFLLFGVGFLLLAGGAVPLALGLRRSGALGSWWIAVLVAGAGAVVALLASADPWHDLGLFVFDAAWFALGLRVLAAERASVPA